jgi:hypothetical protein
MIQNRVIAEFQQEVERAKQPGYVPKYDEEYGFDAGEDYVAPPQDQVSEPAAAVADQRRIDRSLVAAEPRAPHYVPPATATPASDSGGGPHTPKPQRQRGEFGAGIFD